MDTASRSSNSVERCNLCHDQTKTHRVQWTPYGCPPITKHLCDTCSREFSIATGKIDGDIQRICSKRYIQWERKYSEEVQLRRRQIKLPNV
jgi:hypothetical protein